MVEFIKSILRWIILAIIIILIIVLIYNIANASSKKVSKNSSLSSGVRTVEPSNKKNKTNNNSSSSSSSSTDSSDKDLAVLEDNTNQEVTTPDTASFSGLSVFLGVAILGGTTYYLLKKTEVIK